MRGSTLISMYARLVRKNIQTKQDTALLCAGFRDNVMGLVSATKRG
jgi:hypothetical protein